MRRFRILAAGLLAALASATAAAAQEPLRQEETFLRVRLDRRDVRLETLIVRPEGATGRLPLALITHGKSASTIDMGSLRAERYATVARDLARRGWLAAVVVRRGFGQSDGPSPTATTCEKPAFLARFNADADEIEAALRELQKREDVDPERAIALGESAGGMAALALARRKPPGLRAVLNLAGGLNLEDCVDKSRDALVQAVAELSGQGGLPQLWLYARNDELFPAELVDRMLSAGRDAGADIRHVQLPEIKPVGHHIFRHGVARYTWQREMDTSLRAWKLPTWPLERARRLYARLGLKSGADSFERYFAAPGEKAMAYSEQKKRFSYWYGNDEMEKAKASALRDCKANAQDCAVIFENDRFLPGE